MGTVSIQNLCCSSPCKSCLETDGRKERARAEREEDIYGKYDGIIQRGFLSTCFLSTWGDGASSPQERGGKTSIVLYQILACSSANPKAGELEDQCQSLTGLHFYSLYKYYISLSRSSSKLLGQDALNSFLEVPTDGIWGSMPILAHKAGWQTEHWPVIILLFN